MSERQVQKAIIDYLLYKNIYVWKNHSTGIYNKKTGGYIPVGKKGVSDILGILPDGRFLAIEVKYKNNKPSINQIKFIQDILERGGVGFFAKDIDQVENTLEMFNKRYNWEK